jgi:hypothetical protein
VVAKKSVVGFKLWLEFELWEDSTYDPEDDFANITITLETGERYALNVWTFKFLNRAHSEDQSSGECLGGRYLVPPDLLVQKLNRAHLEAIVTDLLEKSGLKEEWLSMSMIGNYRRVTPSELATLQTAPDTISEFLYPDDKAVIADRRLDIDKSWHVIHFLLTGETWEAAPPLGNAVLGGQVLGEQDVGYGPARFLMPAEVQEAINALNALPTTDLYMRFSFPALRAAQIYPDIWDEDDEATKAEEWEYVMWNYDKLVAFFHAAAEQGDAILLYIN